jgi:hypothetical protein
MWKKVLFASAAVAIAGTTLVYAQRFGGPDGPGPMRGVDRFRPSAEDLGAFADARIAGMKAGLRLTAEQEKSWPAFEEAYRNLAKLRAERATALREGAPPPADMLEALQRRAEGLSRGAAAFKQVADATAPLYRSLDDGQKRRFTVLARMLRPMQASQGFRHGRRDRGEMGPGDRGPGGFGSGRFQRGGYDGPRWRDDGAREVERIRFRQPRFERESADKLGAGGPTGE